MANDYDPGEYSAWQSAVPLKALLATLHSQYGDSVYVLAHSMGNVVTGEALRLAATQSNGQLVNTYVATQAAVPAQCYDPSMDLSNPMPFVSTWHSITTNWGPTTPNIYDDWLTPNNGGVGSKFNFYNSNDFALTRWVWDQRAKPDALAGAVTQSDSLGYADAPYDYDGDPSLPATQTGFEKAQYDSGGHHVGLITLILGTTTAIDSRYEIMAFAAEPRSKALGACSVGVGLSSINLTATGTAAIWPTDPYAPHDYSEHPWHSAQFEFDNAQMDRYWNTFMSVIHLPTNHSISR